MTWTEEDKQAMDNAAIDAENDLASESYPEEHIVTVANWWSVWYIKAGHKRLARILLQYKGK